MTRQEKLSLIGKNPFYTERFALFVGHRYERQHISSLALELKLDWKTVREMEKEYRRGKLKQTPIGDPPSIGIDEISTRKVLEYRIAVSNLVAPRPIWFGSCDRSEDILDEFFSWPGTIPLKPFRRIQRTCG